MTTYKALFDSYALASEEDRSSPRTRISIPSALRPSCSKPFQTIVQDLSLSGFSAMSVSRLHNGTKCWLTMPGLGSLQSEVIWWDSGVVGCAFESLLSPIILDSLVSRWQTKGAFRSIA